jgi:hypothetical protein
MMRLASSRSLAASAIKSVACSISFSGGNAGTLTLQFTAQLAANSTSGAYTATSLTGSLSFTEQADVALSLLKPGGASGTVPQVHWHGRLPFMDSPSWAVSATADGWMATGSPACLLCVMDAGTYLGNDNIIKAPSSVTSAGLPQVLDSKGRRCACQSSGLTRDQRPVAPRSCLQ